MAPTLQESAYADQLDYLEFAVEDERQTFVYLTRADLQWTLDNQDMVDVTEQLPDSRDELDSRIDGGTPTCEVTVTRTESGLIRSKEVEVTNAFDLERLRDAAECLPGEDDPIAAATVYMKTAENAPLMVELPRSPRELVELRTEHRPGEFDGAEAPSTDDPSCCMVPATETR